MKIVLITGIGRGIGKALAQKFLTEGWKVFGTSTSGEVDFTDEHLSVFRIDLSKPESITECVKQIADTGVSVDILINNAGALFDDEETRVFIEKLRQTLEVNLVGTVDFTERVIPLIEQGGHILNISSRAGSLELVGKASHSIGHYPSYRISKAALNMYTRTLALRLAHEKKGITVSSVHPGWVKTEMGGDDADITPEEAAEDIYTFAISKPPTGQFWFKGEEFAW